MELKMKKKGTSKYSVLISCEINFFFVFYRTVMIRQDVFEGLACVWVLAR